MTQLVRDNLSFRDYPTARTPRATIPERIIAGPSNNIHRSLDVELIERIPENIARAPAADQEWYVVHVLAEDDDGYKSNGTVVDHTNLRFWRSLQQNVRRSASPSAVSATSMDEYRANPIATLTAAPTIVNAPGNTVSHVH